MSIQSLEKPPPELVLALKTFRIRSSKRDRKVDSVRISSVIRAVNAALRETIAERDGLVGRIKTIIRQPDAVLERALKRREPEDGLFSREWVKAEQRLDELDNQISRLQLLKSDLISPTKSTLSSI